MRSKCAGRAPDGGLARAASKCGAIATLSRYLNNATLRGELLGLMPLQRIEGGLIMTTGSLLSSEQTTPIKEVFATNDVRTLAANYLGLSILGADWLDRRATKPTKQQERYEQVALFF
jgi:hypothetical protein